MERINYASGSVVTGDRLAHAIVAYARALAKRGDSDTVTFPVLLENGEIGEAEVLIGPASQMMNVSELTDHGPGSPTSRSSPTSARGGSSAGTSRPR